MTFLEYIRTRRLTDTPAGDFTRDARADGRLPDARTWRELRSYLEGRGAIREAIAAAHQVWTAYQARLRDAEPDINQRAKAIVDRVTGDD